MTNNAAKRRIWLAATAAIIAVALLLSCAFAAFLYTRTGENPGENTVAGEGSAADDNALLNAQYGYGGRRPGDTAPSGSYVKNIANATDLEDFLNSSTYTYGLLTQSFTIGNEVKPSLNRTLAEGKTLDGNGYTITTYFTETAALDCRRVDGGLTSDWYKSWFTFQQNGTGNAVDIGNGLSAFGVSNIVSVNRGTIKNLSVAVSGGTNAKAVVTAPEGYDGNIGMGVVAGINFGTVENCVSTINVTYGFYGSPVQAWSNTASNSNNKILSRQGLVAVGGVVGINKGTILNTQVNQNADLGTYRPVYTVEYDWNNKETSAIYNDNIGSGIVGGVAGLNDGGTVNGVDYNSTAGSIRNQNNHVANSYTGLIVGLANLQNAKGGEAVSFNVGYYSSGAIQSGGSLPVAAGSVQNIKYNLYSGFSAATEAYAFTGTRGGFMTIASDSWTAKGSYVGLIGGRVSSNSTVYDRIMLSGVSVDGNKYAFRAWEIDELNASLAFADNGMPMFGYGSTSVVNPNQYQSLYVAARLDGQNTESQSSGDFSNDSVFIQKAQVGFVWDSYLNNGVVVNRVLYNVNFDNMSELAGKSYSVYKAEGFVENVSGSVVYGSDDYDASSVSSGGRIEWAQGLSPSWLLMLYSLRIDNFTSVAEFEAFARTDKGSGNEYFAYAFANVVRLTGVNTLDSPSITGDKVLKSWKTLDGKGNAVIISNALNYVSGGSVPVSVGGVQLVGLSDFISVNQGTIKDIKIHYTSSSRTTVSTVNNFAYGRAVGINVGTVSNLGINNDGSYIDATQTSFSTTADIAAVGLAIGANLGNADTIHTIMRQNLSAGANSLAFAGGAVGVNSGGTLKNVIVDGVASATLGATAAESYIGGVLGAGSNYGSISAGTMTLTAPSGGSPFLSWTFVGKQTIQTQGAYTGMLAGRVAGNTTRAENGNSDDYMLKNMVVMMPQTVSAVGWFTGTVGRMSLLGRAGGTEANSGFIATDLVIGYYIYIEDASTSYISKIYKDYNLVKDDNGITAIFSTDVFNGSSAVKSVTAVDLITEYTDAQAAARISFAANLSSDTQSIFIPASVANALSVQVAADNNGNYAPAIKLKYDYDINLSQAANDADGSSSKSALELFMSGDASSVSGNNTHKILAAGANGATLTSDMTLNVTVVADFVKMRGLNGGGNTVTFMPSAISGITYDKDGQEIVAIGVLASVNRSTITDVNVVLSGGATSNVGRAYAFGGITGVNLGTVSGSVDIGSHTLSLSGNDAVGFVGGAVGINRGTADGIVVNYDGGTLYADNSSGIATVLGGAIGLQDSASLSDVHTTGYNGSLVLEGAGYIGGVIGIANAGDGDSVAGISVVQTSLSDISNAVYAMNISAEGGYKGLITGAVTAGSVRSGALSGIAAHYPDGVAEFRVPWTTMTTNSVSMYGYGNAAAQEGTLFKITDFSNDGIAGFLTNRTISVNGNSKSFTFDRSQIKNIDSIGFVATYYYYNAQGELAADDSYNGVPSLSSGIYTTAVNGVFSGSDFYVPAVELLIDYSVILNNGENLQLVDFMRGTSDAGYGSYAGAHKAVLATGAAFTVDGQTAGLRTESSAKKMLIGSGNTISVSGTVPTGTYEGRAVSGGFFAVNRSEVKNVNVTTAEEHRPSGTAFGLFAGANEGKLTGVDVSMTGLSFTGSTFGAVAGINVADVTDIGATLSGTYSINASEVFAGAAFGENSANLSDVVVTFSNATLYANAVNNASAGGVVGRQDGGSLVNVGTAGGNVTMNVATGTGYIGGIVGVINTGNADASVAGQQLSPTTVSGVYAGAYASRMYNGYRGLITGATGGIAEGTVTGAVAHYYESGLAGDYKIPWFTTEKTQISMYGYSDESDPTYVTGVLFKVSDYSYDGDADFVKTRTIVSSATQAQITFSLADFAGAENLTASVYYRTFNGEEQTSDLLRTDGCATSGTYTYTITSSNLNGTGTYVPCIDFMAEYSVSISSGEEGDWQNNSGIAQSMLYCFIDGTGENQLYAGAKTGNIKEDLLIDKPMNGYVTMREEKTLEGNGHTLFMSWVGSYDGNYVLQLGDRNSDNTTSGSGGYVQVDAGGGTTGAAGGLIAVNYGTVRNLDFVHRNYSTATGIYAFTFTENVAAGVLVGVNFGIVENINYDNTTATAAVKFFAQNDIDVIAGGIIGANAAGATARNLNVTKMSANTLSGTGKGIFGGAVGANYGELNTVNVIVGTETLQSDYMSRLGANPASVTDIIVASSLGIWGGAVGYTAGKTVSVAVKANVNYGVNSSGASNLAAGGVIGMSDGGESIGVRATGWGGFFVNAAVIRLTTAYNVFVGGLIGAMNADGAATIGFVGFASEGRKATLTNGVFALSGGMVTMDSSGRGIARYGYVTGVLATQYADIPDGAISNTFWFIADKLQSVEGDDAEIFPVFHGGNQQHPTYISAFGMAPSDWLDTADETENNAAFAKGSYGFTLVDSDDNPINYLTMDVSVSGGVLTLTVHKPTGISAYYTVAHFSDNVTGSGGSGTGTVGDGSSADQTLTVNNGTNTGIGYVTFSFESGVYVLTDSVYAQYMILSFLSTKPCGITGNGQVVGYYSYTTVDGVYSRSLDDAFYRVYQLWSGATEMKMSGSNKTVTISATPGEPIILNRGKLFDGGQDSGYSINVTSSFNNNIAAYTFGGDLEGAKQKYIVVSEFIAINYGTFTNTDIQLSGTGEDDKNINRNATEVLENAANMGLDTSGVTGFIYGMLVGVNEGTVSEFDDYSFDRTISLNSNSGSRYNSIFGGMVGAQSGENALIKDIGHITFGTAERAGGITMSGSANLVAAGGVVGIAIQGRIENVGVTLTANSFLSVTAAHNAATIGGVVGDLRGVLSDVTFNSEYQSVMKISGTNTNGTAALANLVGIVNTFSDSSEQAAIEKAKVTGVGYLYNGIDESGIVTTSSTKLYTAGVVALGSNYGALTAQSDDTTVKELVAAYGEIRPARLDSVYIDFEGYVRAKANTRVGMITARILDGVKSDDGVVATEMNVNYDNLKNLVWQTACEGDNLWTTNVNYADYSAAFNTNTAVAILGYAPVTIDSQNTDIRGAGMRLWLTNNLYSARLSTSDMVTSWTGLGQLSAAISGSLSWKSLESALMYYDESGVSLSERFKTIESLGTQGAASSVIVSVDVVTALSKIKSSANTFSNGIYMLRVTYNEVYIYDAKQLMTFMSAGADTTKGLSSTDSLYSSYANANIGIIANDLSVDYATAGSGNRSGLRFATAVTMRADKILEGNGYTVTIATSGNVQSAVIDNKGNTPAGALLSGEYFWDYIGGLNTLSSADLNQFNTDYSVGIRAGALFLGRNLGTIQNINFSMPNSVTIDNRDYAEWEVTPWIYNRRVTAFGTSLFAGIVTAVNAGTIDNCTLTLAENVQSHSYRITSEGSAAYKGYTNNLTYKVNTMAVNGGFAGLMYGTSSAHSYISNCTVTLEDGSEIRATSQASSFSWSGRNDSVYAYAGGLVGWLTSDSTVYNATINGTGTMTAWGDLDGGGGFSSGNKVTSAGSIVGLNSDHPTYTISNNPDEFGLVDGVICNWNGAAYFLTTGNNNIFYTSSGRVNYYIGAQLAGVAEENTLKNIYFMYGIDEYKTFHMDNWYYGSDTASRKANAEFAEKYEYIKSRAYQLLSDPSFPYDAIWVCGSDTANSTGIQNPIAVASRENGVVSYNSEFTFDRYCNYNSATDSSWVSGAPNFSVFGSIGQEQGFYLANQYFPRITATMDSGGDKNMDYVGARAAAMMTSNGSADWNNLFKPNNVYIYEVAFGVSESNGTALDMNDPDTTAYLSFQTKGINSDVAVNVTLVKDSMGAQFVWKTVETWKYADGGISMSELLYYNNVKSLEQAKENNSFVRIFDRDNNGADFTFTYVMGMAIKIAMDTDRYYYDEEEGVFYDSLAKIYDGNDIEDPTLYYADENGNPINREDMGLSTVKASSMNALYYKEGVTSAVGYYNTESVGAYRVRISFSSEGGENSKVNTINRTMMFSEFNFIDIYTVVLPKGITQGNVFVSKTYDGTRLYNDSTTELLAGKVGNDVVNITSGTYTTANAGAGNIFYGEYEEFTFLYELDGKIEEKTIYVFSGSDKTGNYAPIISSINASGGTTDLVGENINKYYSDRPTLIYAGEIYKKQITLADIDLDMFGGAFTEGGVNPPLEYNALTTYNTESFWQGSEILGATLSISADRNNLIMAGYASGENIRFYISFLPEGATDYEESVKNFGTYTVYINIVDSDNFILYAQGQQTERMSVGQLSITPYELKTANVNYVITSGFLQKIFDNNGTIPFVFDENNLKIIAQDGYEVQPDEYTIDVGDRYATLKGMSASVVAKDAGEYDIYFRISNFNCPLGNYTLQDMTVRFVDENGNQISYFVLPKEIEFSSVTKEFDNTTEVSSTTAQFTYVNGKAPVTGTDDVFGLKYGSLDAGTGLNIIFTNTDEITLNGETYIVVDVVSGTNEGKRNYYTLQTTVAKGNITPVEVVISGVSMIYSNSTIVNYRDSSTSVVIKDRAGRQVNIYPSATFVNKNAGTNKQVNFATDTLVIEKTTYRVLRNSDYVTGSLPESGSEYAGNYYLANTSYYFGEIIKNTLSVSDITNNITVMQTDGANVVAGTEYDFVSALRGKTYVYRYGYYIGFRINPTATVIEGDLLSDHVTVRVTHAEGLQNGYAGTYTIELAIQGSDYEWDSDVSLSDRRVEGFLISKQTLKATDFSVYMAETVFSYKRNPEGTAIDPVFTANDMFGRSFSTGRTLSGLTNLNENFSDKGTYYNGSHLDVGDYRTYGTPVFQGDDRYNYEYSGAGKEIRFSVIPYEISNIIVTKTFDNNTSFSTIGNEAKFSMSVLDSFTPGGSFNDKRVGTGKAVTLITVTTTINNTQYKLLVDAETGKVTNQTYRSASGIINQYVINQTEFNSYILGWVKDLTERQQLSINNGTELEYRSDAASGYGSQHFLFETTGLRFNFVTQAAATSVQIMQNGSYVTSIDFSITVTEKSGATYEFSGGDTSLYVLPVGEYTVALTTNNASFALGVGAGTGSFTVQKQEISGGDASGSANIFIALGGDFSYTYGEANFNLPTVEDEKFTYTLSVIDKYTGKVGATFTQTDAIIGLIEYSLTADATQFYTTLDGPLFVGSYYVWASGIGDTLGNYSVPEGSRIAVYLAGTPVPEVPDPEEGGESGEGEEGGEEGGIITIPSLPAEPAYFILPRTLNITEVSKTYDGNTSFDGATLVSDALEADAITAASLDGVYESANANYDSTGTVRLEGKGSDNLFVNVVTVEIKGVVYNMLAAAGIEGNYCLSGEATANVVTVQGAKIMRKPVDSASVSFTSDTFEKVYGSEETPVLPDVTANLGDSSELVVYGAENVIYKQGGEVVSVPENVGGYEMYLTGISFENYEVAGLTEVLVNAGRVTTDEEEGGDGSQGGEESGEGGGEEEPEETPEVYTYYIVPQEIFISQVIKFYDKTDEIRYYAEDEEGVSAEVTIVDGEGNLIVDKEGNLVILRLQALMSDAFAGKGKDVYADFTPFGYYVNFDVSNPVMYYRLLVVGEDGTANTLSNYCITDSENVILPAQFAEDYVPDPELGYDDTPVINNALVYQMTLSGAGVIVPAPLTVEGADKVYDGTYEITSGALTGMLEGDEGLTAAKWRYDTKDAAPDKIIGIETDGEQYVFGGVTYYAIYVMSGENKILSDYGVAAVAIADVEETVVGEDGQESTVVVKYAVLENAGSITPYALTPENFENVNVAGTVSTEFRSDRTYNVSEINATLKALGFSAVAVNAGGNLTFTFDNEDELTFSATLGGGTYAHDAGTYAISLTLTSSGNYTMSSPYTVNFVISRQSITKVYVITGGIEKEYDGLADLPVYSPSGWTVYAVDKQGALIDAEAFGEINMSSASIVFVRFNEEEQIYEYFNPVNVTENPGYRIYVTGFALDAKNYVFTSQEDAYGCVSFDENELTYELAYYNITPRRVNIAADAFDSKKFDGAYSLLIDSGVQGETVVVGDTSGVNASLAGTYGTLSVKPYVRGVVVGKDALNPETVVENYALYYNDSPIDAATVIEITDYTVDKADIMTAERENGTYAVGISGLQGLDFLFAKSPDITAEAQTRITERLLTGEPWSGGAYDSSSDFAKLNQALLSALSLYVNDSESAVSPAIVDRYLADNFKYVAQGSGYVLSFTFTGLEGYDMQTATDRYTFAVKGNDDSVNSTNASTTSSELESGQMTAATAGTGIAVSTAEQFLQAIKNNSSFYLTSSIYGVDTSEISDAVFSGVFDGRGYTISLVSGAAATNKNGAAGMLVAVNAGTIENVNVKLMPLSPLTAACTGGLTGINRGTISNVSVELVSDFTITGATNAGGITGLNELGASIVDASFTHSADVNAAGAVWGAISGRNDGTLSRIAVRVNESAGAENYNVISAGAGYVAGVSDGAIDGVIVAVADGRLTGAGAITGGGTSQATNVYSYVEIDGAAGGSLSLLEPYTEGYIGYYFAAQDDYTTDGLQHNVLTGEGEYNKSYYVDYSSGAGYIAIEAIAPYNRFVWDGYGISYRSAIGDFNVGSSLNRIVALFAQGDVAQQFEGTTVITSGVNAFTVAIGVRGGNVEVDGDVETSMKEVVYTGVAQIYSVNITVTSGGVSETRTLSVGGTEAGYYSKASLEGIIGGGASGETIGDVTYDSGSRTEYTFSGEGTKVANGIALVIYPRQIDADGVEAVKYYDTTADGTLTLKDGDKDAGMLTGSYFTSAGELTSQVAAAERFGFADFTALTRKVLAKDGVLYEIVQKITGEGESTVITYETQQITVGSGENAAVFSLSDTVGTYTPHDLMIAMSRLADEDYAREVLSEAQLAGFEFVDVYDFTTSVQADADNTASLGATVVFRPVLGGENGGNYTLYSAEWVAPSDLTIGAVESEFSMNANAMTTAGRILAVDLGIYADYTVGKDQSYNSAMLAPKAVSDGIITFTQEQAAALGISSENYAKLVSEAAAGITVSFPENFFDELVSEGVLEKRDDGYFATTQVYATANLPEKADGGNFVVTMRDCTLTFRYFDTTLKEGDAFYVLADATDYDMWIDNEGGTADYYAIDMLLAGDIDFGGKLTDMLAWRDGEGNVQGFKGIFEGNGYAFTGMLIDRAGSAALFERVDEGAVVRNLTVADTVVIATGDGSAAGGIAVDNYGTIENCAFEGVLSASAKTGGIAATNYGVISGGVSVNRAYLDDGGKAEGIAQNAQTDGTTGTAQGVSITESVQGSGESMVEETAIETADGGAAEWNDASLVPVIKAYVFDETYVKTDAYGLFVTDNYFKLNAVDKLFGWVGAAAVTSATQTGFYGHLTIN